MDKKWDFSDWSDGTLQGNYKYLSTKLLRLKPGSKDAQDTEGRLQAIEGEMKHRGLL